MKKSLFVVLFLSGCAGGLDKFSADQLKQMDGRTGCSSLKTAQGNIATVIVGTESFQKTQIGTYKTTISPDCSVVIESSVAPSSQRAASAP